MLFILVSSFPSVKLLKGTTKFQVRVKVYRHCSPAEDSRVEVHPTSSPPERKNALRYIHIPNEPNQYYDGSISELHLIGELLEAIYRGPYLAEYLFPTAAEIHSHCQAGSDDLAHSFVGKTSQDFRLLGLEDHHVVEAVPVRCDVLHLRRVCTRKIEAA